MSLPLPGKRYPIGSAPLTHSLSSKSRAQRSSPPCRHPWTAGAKPQSPPERNKPPAQCKSPCPCYASYLCSIPSRCPIITLLNCTAVGIFHLQTSARQVLTQPHTTGVNGSCRISQPPGAQLLFCQGVGFWRGISICPGFCQSEVLISEEEPKGRFETPRAGAARSLRDDAGPPRGAVQGVKPWSREKAAHRCSPRGEWLLGASRGRWHPAAGLLRAVCFTFPVCGVVGWETKHLCQALSDPAV